MKAIHVLAVGLLFAMAPGCVRSAEAVACGKPGKGIRVLSPTLMIDDFGRVGIQFAARNPAQPQVHFSGPTGFGWR